ncbi:MAG: sigma-54-dependent Fis family transcriptional regulator [Bacteroidota bacterium]
MSDDITTLKTRIRELEELQLFTNSLSATQNVSETLQQIAVWCAKYCRADVASIVLLKPIHGESVVTIARTPESTKENIDHGINAVVSGWVCEHHAPLLTDDVIRDMNIFSPSERQKKCAAALAVPLLLEDQIIGVLNMVNHRGGKNFTEETKRIAMTIAPLAAKFIERARLYEQLSFDNALFQSYQSRGVYQRWIPSVNPAMEEVMDRVKRVAPTDATVMITGETGTGKELVARLLHLQSPRSDKPFIAVNCSAIPIALAESEFFGHERGAFTGAETLHKGKCELAENGTLFLDEISAMPIDLQPKLLRVIEDRRFSRIGANIELRLDARIITATNKDLGAMVKRGEFREDLFHRLNVVPLHLPPLCERTVDIPHLAQSFLKEFSSEQKQFAEKTLEYLKSLEWRGNVRELRNTVERIAILSLSSQIQISDVIKFVPLNIHTQPVNLTSVLNSLIAANADSSNLLEKIEEQLINLALAKAEGNMTHAADLLGIERTAMRRRVDKYSVPGERKISIE